MKPTVTAPARGDLETSDALRSHRGVWPLAGLLGGAAVGLCDAALASARLESASAATFASLALLGVPLFLCVGAIAGVMLQLALRAAGWSGAVARGLADQDRPGGLAAALLALLGLGVVLASVAPVLARAFEAQRPALAVLVVAAAMGLGVWLARWGHRRLRAFTLPGTWPTLAFTSAVLALLGHFVFREGGPLEAVDARPLAALGAGLLVTLASAAWLCAFAPRPRASGRRSPHRRRAVVAAGALVTLTSAGWSVGSLGGEAELRALSEGTLIGRGIDAARLLLRLDHTAGTSLRAWALSTPHSTPRPPPMTKGTRPATPQPVAPTATQTATQIATQIATPTVTQTATQGAPRAAALAAGAKPPHVVLITVDALRADHLGLYGYARATSPELDAFARSAAVFERAYSQEAKTKGSIPSLLTGRFPSSIRWGGRRYVPLHPSETTFVEGLLSAGYHTAGFVTHSYFLPQQGMARGFAHYDTSLVSTQPEVAFGRPSSAALTERVLAHLRRVPADRPFFVWAHYFDPHERYLKHEGFSRFGERAIDRYDGEIAYTDHHVGRLLRALRAHPEADNIVVVLTADHGEAFGEHGARFHGRTLYEEEIRVPLLVSGPGIRAGRVRTPVALVDVAPTLLSLVGLPASHEHQGRSLAPALRGEALPVVPIFSEILPEDRIGPRSAIVLGDHKLIFDERRNALLLFDLAVDPGERQSLLQRDPERARAMAAQLFTWRRGPDALAHPAPGGGSGSAADPRVLGASGLR